MLDKIFLQILNMSFTASYVIILVLLARLLLKKVPKIFSYALWSVVLFRLVCPFSFESNLSWFHLTGRTIEQMRPFPEEFTTLNNALPTANATIELLPITETPMSFVSGIFTLLWLVGIVALLLYSVASLLRLRHKLIGAVKLRDHIYLADHIQSPFVIGVMRPKIYLPSTLSEREQSYIILHEQTHIKRFDHIVKILAFCTLSIHWFNPLVWLAFVLWVKDMEMSCDESVMKQMGTDIRKEYSASLLSLATGAQMIAGTPLAFGQGDMKGRIKNVLNYKKPAFWVIAMSVIAVVAIGIGLMANPKSNTTDLYGSSAKDVLNRYTLALAASDITGMRHFMPTLNPPVQDVIDVWKQIKIESVEVLKEDIRENKAEFKLSVTVKEAPDGFGMWTPGTAPHYLYVEKCDRGWYVESYGAGGRSQSDLDAWWNQSNLIDSATAFDLKPMLMLGGNLYLDTGQEEPMGAAVPIDGKILSTVEQTKMPAENGQSNFGFLGSSYCIDKHGVVVQLNDKWIRFEKDATPVDQTNNTASSKQTQEVITYEDFSQANKSKTINQQLQDRLQTAINGIEIIESSTVKISDDKSSVAVELKLMDNMNLSDEQKSSITALVKNSVGDVSEDNIRISTVASLPKNLTMLTAGGGRTTNTPTVSPNRKMAQFYVGIDRDLHLSFSNAHYHPRGKMIYIAV